jgi:hypothetical protein
MKGFEPKGSLPSPDTISSEWVKVLKRGRSRAKRRGPWRWVLVSRRGRSYKTSPKLCTELYWLRRIAILDGEITCLNEAGPAAGVGAALTSFSNQRQRMRIDALSPAAVIMLGIAFGVDESNQAMLP